MWRSRWDSLRLFTAAQYNDLPGMTFPADPRQLPGQGRGRRLPPGLRGQVRAAGPPRHPGHPSHRARRRLPGRDQRRDDRGRPGRRRHRPVPGPVHARRSPSELDPSVRAASQRRLPPPGRPAAGQILVVGAANSGQQIALELAEPRHGRASRSARSCRRCRSGRSAATSGGGSTTTGLARVPVRRGSASGSPQRDVVIGGGLRELQRHGVERPAARDRRQRPHDHLRRRRVSASTTRSSGRPDSGSTTPGSTSPRSRTSAARSATCAA